MKGTDLEGKLTLDDDHNNGLTLAESNYGKKTHGWVGDNVLYQYVGSLTFNGKIMDFYTNNLLSNEI